MNIRPMSTSGRKVFYCSLAAPVRINRLAGVLRLINSSVGAWERARWGNCSEAFVKCGGRSPGDDKSHLGCLTNLDSSDSWRSLPIRLINDLPLSLPLALANIQSYSNDGYLLNISLRGPLSSLTPLTGS